MASASHAGTFLVSLITFTFCQFIALINLALRNINGLINLVPLQEGQSHR